MAVKFTPLLNGIPDGSITMNKLSHDVKEGFLRTLTIGGGPFTGAKYTTDYVIRNMDLDNFKPLIINGEYVTLMNTWGGRVIVCCTNLSEGYTNRAIGPDHAGYSIDTLPESPGEIVIETVGTKHTHHISLEMAIGSYEEENYQNCCLTFSLFDYCETLYNADNYSGPDDYGILPRLIENLYFTSYNTPLSATGYMNDGVENEENLIVFGIFQQDGNIGVCINSPANGGKWSIMFDVNDPTFKFTITDSIQY